MLPNFVIDRGFEMDVFKLTPSGLITEFEIKTSKMDFRLDFKKKNKHDLLKNGQLSCNRFFFVTPCNLLKLEDIPSYAGWYELSETKYKSRYFVLSLRKNAPLLHKNKFENYRSLAEKLGAREHEHRRRARADRESLQRLYERTSKK